MRSIRTLLLIGFAAVVVAAPAHAQEEESNRGLRIDPYIEVSQVLSAELTPGDEILTYTQVAAGVDVSAIGRNAGGSVSVRYERNIGYGDDVIDNDTVSGIARGYVAIVPNAVTLQAGALASRTRVDGAGGTTSNPLVNDGDAEGQIYSGYVGPTLATRVGAVDVTGAAQIGYSRFDTDNAVLDNNGDPVDVFDESVTYNSQLRLATRARDVLPVGIGVEGGFFQEDISNLDQRVRDIYARADVTVPLSSDLALVGGVGYEDVEISSRDAVRDINGDPVIGADGRFVTDSSAPRVLAYDVDGVIWDAGILWTPSRRTTVSATVGRRYDSMTYTGSISYVPNKRSQFAVTAYDGVTGFGGLLTNSLSVLPTEFQAVRNSLTGDFGGCVGTEDGASCIDAFGSIRSSTFRSRGVQASYQRRVGRFNAAIAAGYDRREFIAAAGTVLEDADGLTDESYYLTGALSRDIGRNANVQANAYANWFSAGADGGDVTAYGASAAYNQSIAGKLSARAAVAVDYIDSEFSAEDIAFATALIGLSYDF